MALRSGEPEVNEEIYLESDSKAITTGNNDDSIDLAKGTVGQTINTVYISAPGASVGTTIQFYDGAPATIPITAALYLAAQPEAGFVLNLPLSSGTLGYRIAGNTATTTAYMTVRYYYQ